jgi:hypothetical protein
MMTNDNDSLLGAWELNGLLPSCAAADAIQTSTIAIGAWLLSHVPSSRVRTTVTVPKVINGLEDYKCIRQNVIIAGKRVVAKQHRDIVENVVRAASVPGVQHVSVVGLSTAAAARDERGLAVWHAWTEDIDVESPGRSMECISCNLRLLSEWNAMIAMIWKFASEAILPNIGMLPDCFGALDVDRASFTGSGLEEEGTDLCSIQSLYAFRKWQWTLGLGEHVLPYIGVLNVLTAKHVRNLGGLRKVRASIKECMLAANYEDKATCRIAGTDNGGAVVVLFPVKPTRRLNAQPFRRRSIPVNYGFALARLHRVWQDAGVVMR